MKNIICQLFGHMPNRGYYRTEGGGYFDLKIGNTDGIGCVHGWLYCHCERCGEYYNVGKLHVPLGVKPYE